MTLHDYLFDVKPQVGLLAVRAPGVQHGQASLRTPDGQTVHMGLVVDRPDMLRKPNREMISDMFEQIRRMGGKPIYIEIHLNGVRRIFEDNNAVPIFTERLM